MVKAGSKQGQGNTGPYRTIQDHAGPDRTRQDHKGPYETIRDKMGSCGTIRDDTRYESLALFSLSFFLINLVKFFVKSPVQHCPFSALVYSLKIFNIFYTQKAVSI